MGEMGAKRSFNYTALRPQLVTGLTPGGLNVIPAIGVYAAINTTARMRRPVAEDEALTSRSVGNRFGAGTEPIIEKVIGSEARTQLSHPLHHPP